jgi:hypothetical protein
VDKVIRGDVDPSQANHSQNLELRRDFLTPTYPLSRTLLPDAIYARNGSSNLVRVGAALLVR